MAVTRKGIVPPARGLSALRQSLCQDARLIHRLTPRAVENLVSTARPIAVSTLKRSRVMPEIPTIHEQGVKGFDISVWYAIPAAAGTPAAIVQ